MRRIASSFAVLAVAVLSAAACNSYNPNLGDTPFRCGDGDPPCPDGYTCTTFSPGDSVCVSDDPSGGADGGGTGFNCLDDSEIESNDDLATATGTPIPTQDTMFSLVGLAICPDTDVDIFRFGVDINGRNLRADISFDQNQSDLVLEVFNNGGTTIRTGEVASAGLKRAEIPNMPPGEYFVSVKSTTGFENNYSIEIEITGP